MLSREREDNVLQSTEFKWIYDKVFDTQGTQGQFITAYLKDVPSLLLLICAAPEGDDELHMEAQREMLKFCFAFNHMNYARYLTYKHVYLTHLDLTGHPAIEDMRYREELEVA